MRIKETVKKELLDLSDEKYKEFHSNLCPGTDNIIGIRVPILRDYAKKLSSKYDIDILLDNIDNEYYEEIMLQGMIIGLLKEKDFDKIITYIERFVPRIDNWAVCDVFCAGLKITKKKKDEMRKFILKYSNSKKEFEIRFLIVMILDFYIEDKYLEDNFELFDSIKYDKYYVQMSIAWAISISLIKYYDKTIKYLEKCRLDNFTYNKSIQKAIESYRISKEQKDYLRTIKRK